MGNRRSLLRYAAAIVLGVALTACGVGGGPSQAEGTPVAGTATPIEGIEGSGFRYIASKVAVSHVPELYEPFTVTGTFTALEDAEDAELWLGTNAMYLDGERAWHGPLAQGQQKTLTATFAPLLEGRYAVTARVTEPDWETSKPLHLEVGAVPPAADCCGLTTDVNSPPWVSAPGVHVADTALLLNKSDSPRVELIASREDLSRLQAQGLIPDPFRYNWSPFNSGYLTDFSKKFFLAIYGPQRTSPACFIQFDPVGFIRYDDGRVQVSLSTHCAPAEVPQPNRAVSPVLVLYFARNETLLGSPQQGQFAYRGTEAAIDLTLDGQALTPIAVNLP